MSHTPKVTYFYKQKRSSGSITHPCFSTLSENYEEVVYHCPIDKSLTKEEISFWRKLLNNVLNNKYFSEKIEEDKFIFTLQTNKLASRITSLLYLTFVRYFDEFPEIIKDTYQQSEDKEKFDVNEAFINLQNSHSKRLVWKYGNSGHALMPLNIYGGSTKNITLQEFQKRLETRVLSVYAFFN